MALEKATLLFDSECMYCNRMVKAIIEKDKNNLIRFAPLSCLPIKFPEKAMQQTILLLCCNNIYIRSEASLKVAEIISMNPILINAARLFPRTILDIFYKSIAALRKNLSNKNHCVNPNLYPGKFLSVFEELDKTEQDLIYALEDRKI